jgi:glycerol-3-phosphate dehydrogenase (NAD(P)+)
VSRVAVLGAGNWGATLAHLAGRNGHDAIVWTRDVDTASEVNERHRNEASLPGLVLDARVRASTSLVDCVSNAEAILIAIPAQAFREVSRQLGEILTPAHVVIHASKGLELGTHRRMSEILVAETCAKKIGVLSGPNIATEVAASEPAGTVIASPMPAVVRWGRRILSSKHLMVFSSTDVRGVEICGALKNVVAIAAGIADELGFGENSKAFLVTRGLAEIERIGAKLGARAPTISGLAGVGDLVATCRSKRSRNHRVGAALARGEKLDDIVANLGMVAEGVPTAVAAHEITAHLGVFCPLFEGVYRVLHEGVAPAEAIDELLQLPAGKDVTWG